MAVKMKEIQDFKIVDKIKLGVLQGKIHLLKVNYNWDFMKENKSILNTKEDYMEWILDIDKDIKELYAAK